MKSLKGVPILVTGGGGFFGKALVQKLIDAEAEVFAPQKVEYDLRDHQHVRQLYGKYRPVVVIHAAAHGGGIGYMQRYPADVYYDNIMMNTLMLHEALEHQIEKFISIGTVCSYPKFSPVPFSETDLWDGYPEETNSAYGLAKKMMIVQLEAYRQQHGMKGFQLLFSNLYGPGDNFNPASSHVIPALIRRFIEAKEKRFPVVTLWGSGNATREFLYVEDAAEAVLQALEHYTGMQPVNVGVGQDISIMALVEILQEIIDYSGKVIWDPSKPDGQPRRCLDVSRARREFLFQAKTSLREGLKNTVEWYLHQGRVHAPIC